MKIEVFQRLGFKFPMIGGFWYFLILSKAGEIIAECGPYKTKLDAMVYIHMLRGELSNAEIVHIQ